ncbi:MAG TPA: hypothetical protein VNE16_07155 [Vicinamibacterales bacterium]|nr:hypothetical protein [Vicinamibacterales bacterium]
MIHFFDPVRHDALVRLLARADPADLPRRSHVYRCEGDPNRRTTRLPLILMGWLQQHHCAVDLEDLPAPVAQSPHRQTHVAGPALRVLRPTGTG